MAKKKRATINIDQLERVIRCGQKMSNVLYNIKQAKDVPEPWRSTAEILQTEWDSLKQGGDTLKSAPPRG